MRKFFKEASDGIDMEVSPVHESSLLDEQRKEVRESSVDLFEKPIKRFHDCSGLISKMSHVTISESSIYEEAARRQVWKM